MLTPKEYKLLPINILKLFEDLEYQVIADIAKKLKENLELSETSGYQLEQIRTIGYDLQDVKREIAKASDLSMRKVDSLMKQSSHISYKNDNEAYKVGKKKLPPLAENPAMVDFINATIKQTKGELKNMTNTLGFVDRGKFKDLDKFYKETLDYAAFQLGSGAYDYNTVLRQAIKKLGDSGLRTIDYASGRSYHIESATRMTLMTGVSQITGYMSESNADMMSQDLMEITAHMGARPDHQEWQGQIVSRSGSNGKYLSLDDIGYETVEGFKGANCRHDWFPFFEGISESAYAEGQLKEIDPPDFEYEGKTYNAYDANQKQRQIERNIRKTKRDLIAFESAGLEDDFTSASIKLRRQRDLYKDFSDKAGLRAKDERHQTYDFGRSIAGKTSKIK